MKGSTIQDFLFIPNGLNHNNKVLLYVKGSNETEVSLKIEKQPKRVYLAPQMKDIDKLQKGN